MGRSQTSRPSVTVWSALVITIASGSAMLLGCSADARTRVMHFFFEYPPSVEPDRIPNVERSVVAEAASGPTKSAPRFASRHAPFTERACQSCHVSGAGQAPRSDFADACRECHAPYFAYRRFGHAPVVTQDCRYCHTMHTSRYPALLKAPQAEMCTSCHAAQQDEAALTSYHRGIDVVACTSCHDPHFADNPLLLKPEDVRRALNEARSTNAESDVNR